MVTIEFQMRGCAQGPPSFSRGPCILIPKLGKIFGFVALSSIRKFGRLWRVYAELAQSPGSGWIPMGEDLPADGWEG